MELPLLYGSPGYRSLCRRKEDAQQEHGSISCSPRCHAVARAMRALAHARLPSRTAVYSTHKRNPKPETLYTRNALNPSTHIGPLFTPGPGSASALYSLSQSLRSLARSGLERRR